MKQSNLYPFMQRLRILLKLLHFYSEHWLSYKEFKNVRKTQNR